ncbi:male accessory gland serine protease inhibitor [Drosophila busckii]|uniref:male accessory gland serine protease inhibitor n=1 Tax=Drosophila busckii TaxID=30019 RepID=UPI00143342AF|nr:male accessory gland serine protease inhibitor [Drosophila busckii]
MKCILLIATILLSIASCLAFKNAVCGEPHSLDGDGLRACAAFHEMWSFNAKDNKCVKFVFGGCGGNGNRFETQELCEEKCVVYQDPVAFVNSLHILNNQF